MSLKSFFSRVLPPVHEIRKIKNLQILGKILHDPHIFHITRRSSSGGVACGLFFACMPVPGQMLLSALVAIFFRINLPLAVVLVWLTNPLTIPPYLYMAYKTGAWILHIPARQIQFEMSLAWASEKLLEIWEPLLLGCLVYGLVASLTGYVITHELWRLAAVKKWEERKARRK